MPAASTAKLSVQVLDFDVDTFSSSLTASYAISVRRASAMPAASFRFHLAMDTLAVRLTIPPVGLAGDFHSPVRALPDARQKCRHSCAPAVSPDIEVDLQYNPRCYRLAIFHGWFELR